MVGSSKILTVSYGTFSCTLEGFDDSFSTMKAIAEYFRDLAADDRYFGAEPPTPDAEMLARIAEREVSRRVEVQTKGSGIVLKTGAALTAAAAVADMSDTDDATEEEAEDSEQAEARVETAFVEEPETQVDPEPVMPPAAQAPVQIDGQAEELVPTQDYEDDEFTDAPVASAALADIPTHPDAESVAAKLQRIRAVVGRNADDAASSDSLYEATVDTGGLEASTDLSDDTVASTDIHNAFTDIGDDLYSDVDEPALIDQGALIEDTSDEVEAEAEVEVEVEVEDVAAEDHSETADDVEVDEVEAEINDDSDDVEIADTTVEDSSDTDSNEAVDLDGNAESILAPVRARVIRMRRSEATPEDTAPEDATEQLEDDVETADLTESLNDLTAEVEQASEETFEVTSESVEDLQEDTSSLDADDEAELQAELASLAGDLEGDELSSETALSDRIASVLSEEANSSEPLALTAEHAVSEEDILSEQLADDLANVAEASEEAEVELDDPEETSAAGILRPRRVRMPGSPDEDEASMSRIMSQTEEEMSAPETSRRRDAIAQLKAAVAAKEADQEVSGDDVEDDSPENVFRDDLRQVVRPTRPIRPTRPDARTERPQPAPLKLVQEQRVDIAGEDATPQAPIIPVRPRRVSASAAAVETVAASDGEGFAAFAEKMGAHDLADLLEAAAAYTAFVEGSEDFSRPQLMTKVQEMSETEYSREEGLRSFGTLIRQGRITKVRNGRFQVSDETRFHPERRAG